MNEDMEEIVMESFVAEEIDLDYEFDAATFYDFTRAETDLEAIKAERWFESAQSYPPSPLIVKLKKWGKDLPVESRNTETRNSSGNGFNKGFHFYKQMAEAGPKAKTKSPVKPTLSRSSTLMKPTASHLAKQKKPGVHSTRFLSSWCSPNWVSPKIGK
ncbi:hypothetical protein F2P56_001064 [Juglans regia]|uniref:Protein TPX2-like n=2 Tax=Juglans regia TaxID=51240 RepID=A0A833YD33_JUGRE|nr:uncharacterized protein LOC108998544 isoform X1 [Juglans regia]KAF5480304.1 hypothetical protein F2P56_001064 [Juglans regia]